MENIKQIPAESLKDGSSILLVDDDGGIVRMLVNDIRLLENEVILFLNDYGMVSFPYGFLLWEIGYFATKDFEYTN